ncbi:hypothetical protein ACF073_40060 [Streptomyces sp. NPDC015171]|uniref:hypothetical protein n=1 Tax=Streptomyces sp. NPDC015171 TaxID=3364945 RepID=UPI0036FE1F28
MAATGDAGTRDLLAWVGELHSLGAALHAWGAAAADGPRQGGDIGAERGDAVPPDLSAWAPALIRAWARIDG